jgi:Tol biopolymer transport system component
METYELFLCRRTLAALLSKAVVVASTVAMVALIDPEPARAAFPGTNGKIAFFSDRDGNGEIYRMNTDGTFQQNLTNSSTGNDVFPAYSPDGTKIAFLSDRDGNREIYRMSASGGSQTNLTQNSAHDEAPTWQPLP